MKSILSSLWNFILSLTFIDIVFFTAVLILIILIVIMIYIMRTDEELEFDYGEDKKNVLESELSKSEEQLDLLSITKELDNEPPKTIELTPYEAEQEERAIISYDELINSNTGQMKLNYEKEEDDDGVTVKKVDMDNLNVLDDSLPKLANHNEANNDKIPVISYSKEEDFLAALKKMQQMLY